MSETKEVSSMNIYEKIQAVSLEVMTVEKDLEVGKGNYKYSAVSDLSVTLAVKKAEEKYRLVSVPIKQEVLGSEVIRSKKDNGQEQLLYVENIKMTVVIVNLDKPDEELYIESLGKGIDSADKGFGKASTYARKYALLNAYKIATGEDPDSEKSPTIKQDSQPDEKLVALSNYLDKRSDLLSQVLDHFKVGKLEELNPKQLSSLYQTYKQKNLI